LVEIILATKTKRNFKKIEEKKLTKDTFKVTLKETSVRGFGGSVLSVFNYSEF